MNIKNALIQLRNELGINQTELALLLNVSNITVNRWEKGKSSPNRLLSNLLLSVAKEKGASKICIATLQEALFPTVRETGLDDLKYVEIDEINSLINNSSNAVIVCDVETHDILYMNHHAEEITNRSEEEAEKEKCFEFLQKRETPCEDCKMFQANTEEFKNFDYFSPNSNRYYVVRGKLITWKNRPAFIEYITDATELYQTKQELEVRERSLYEASRFADLYVFKYDVKRKHLYTGKRMQEELGFAPIIEEYTGELAQESIICEESQADLKRLFYDVRQGKDPVEADVRAKLADRGIHWIRLRMNTIQYDEQGNPEIAICSAQVVDTEKMLENRFRSEKERQKKELLYNVCLLGYATTNLTKNYVKDSKDFEGKELFAEPGLTLEKALEISSRNILSERERQIFYQMHERERLIQNCLDGICSETMEYQYRREDNRIIWIRNEWALLLEPISGDILLCEYAYDINEEKLYKNMLDAVVRYNFEFYAAIYLESKHVVLVDMTQEERDFVECPYDKAVIKYCKDEIPEEDWGAYCRMVSITNIKEQLKEKGVFGFNYRMRTKDETFE